MQQFLQIIPANSETSLKLRCIFLDSFVFSNDYFHMLAHVFFSVFSIPTSLTLSISFVRFHNSAQQTTIDLLIILQRPTFNEGVLYLFFRLQHCAWWHLLPAIKLAFVFASNWFEFVSKNTNYLNISTSLFFCLFLPISSGLFPVSFLLIISLALDTYMVEPISDATFVISSIVSVTYLTARPKTTTSFAYKKRCLVLLNTVPPGFVFRFLIIFSSSHRINKSVDDALILFIPTTISKLSEFSLDFQFCCQFSNVIAKSLTYPSKKRSNNFYQMISMCTIICLVIIYIKLMNSHIIIIELLRLFLRWKIRSFVDGLITKPH